VDHPALLLYTKMYRRRIDNLDMRFRFKIIFVKYLSSEGKTKKLERKLY
jgi:hypothetical protein